MNENTLLYIKISFPTTSNTSKARFASPGSTRSRTLSKSCLRSYKKLASVQSILLHSLPASMRSSGAVWVNLTGMKATEIRLKLCNEIAMIGYDVIHKHSQTKAPSHTLEHRSEHVHFTYYKSIHNIILAANLDYIIYIYTSLYFILYTCHHVDFIVYTS